MYLKIDTYIVMQAAAAATSAVPAQPAGFSEDLKCKSNYITNELDISSRLLQRRRLLPCPPSRSASTCGLQTIW